MALRKALSRELATSHNRNVSESSSFYNLRTSNAGGGSKLAGKNLSKSVTLGNVSSGLQQGGTSSGPKPLTLRRNSAKTSGSKKNRRSRLAKKTSIDSEGMSDVIHMPKMVLEDTLSELRITDSALAQVSGKRLTPGYTRLEDSNSSGAVTPEKPRKSTEHQTNNNSNNNEDLAQSKRTIAKHNHKHKTVENAAQPQLQQHHSQEDFRQAVRTLMAVRRVSTFWRLTTRDNKHKKK